jgi:glycosyltransferase involved in cell wall biosynthesis
MMRTPLTRGVFYFIVRKQTEKPVTDGKGVAQEPYRILMVAPTSFFSDYGCSVRILEEAKTLQKQGNKVTICTYRNGQDIPGLPIRRTLSIPFRQHYEVGSSPHKVAFDLLLFWTVLFAALRRRPDVIHAHMHEGALIGLMVSRLLRIPMVFDFQGSLTSEMMDHKFLHEESRFYRPLRWLETTLDRLSSVILTSSHNAKQLLITDFGCRSEQVQTVPDCVNTHTFYPPDEDEQIALANRKASLGIPLERRIVVYLGLLADYQGTDALLQAAARLLQQRDDVHFLIMGFPAVDYYQQMAHQLGVATHTTFTGKIPYGEARGFLALGDVAVAPKLSVTEGSGKILNYMAMGLPTVAFDTPVSREYLGNLGIYATPGDPESLSQALLEGLPTEENRLRGARLRQVAAETYSWDQAVETILRAYQAVCHRRSSVL